MSYYNNINEIDSRLKNLFEKVNINSNDHRILDIKLSNPVNENFNDHLEMRLFVSQKNLNGMTPVLEWGYYTNPAEPKDSISFRSPIERIDVILEDVIKNNRLNESYLDSLKGKEDIKPINESNVQEIEEGLELNQTYDLSEGHLNLHVNKLKSYIFTKLGLNVDDILIKYLDESTSDEVKATFSDPNRKPTLGDISEVTLKNIRSIYGSGDVSSASWINLEQELRKLPFVQNTMTSQSMGLIQLVFDTKVLVELV